MSLRRDRTNLNSVPSSLCSSRLNGLGLFGRISGDPREVWHGFRPPIISDRGGFFHVVTISLMANDTYALFTTSEGNFKIRLFADKTPRTVENFISLADGSKTGKPF